MPGLKARENAVTFEELGKTSGWSKASKARTIRGGAGQVDGEVVQGPEVGQETSLPSR